MPDRRSISRTDPNTWFWIALLVFGAVLPTFYVDDYVYSVLVLFGLYGTINLMWSLVIGTAGILSFATVAIVGVGAYLSTYLSVKHGWSWPAMFPIAAVAGALLGAIVAAPAIRLRGVYFALLTFGLVELFRSYASLSDYLGLAYGLFGTSSFVPERFDGTHTGSIIAYYASVGLLAVALLIYWVIDRGRLGLLLRTARESEPFARALGVDIVRARFAVFVVSSAMLGLTGAFYASYYKGVSPSIFDFGKVLLLDQHYLSAGPPRFIAIGVLMLVVTLFTENGLDGLPAQVRASIRARRARRQTGEAGPTSTDVGRSFT